MTQYPPLICLALLFSVRNEQTLTFASGRAGLGFLGFLISGFFFLGILVFLEIGPSPLSPGLIPPLWWAAVTVMFTRVHGFSSFFPF